MKPVFVQSGNSQVKIIPTLKAGRRYWLIVDKSQGKRRLLNCATLEAAKERALELAKLTEAEAIKLASYDIADIRREWLQATELLKGRASILTAVHFYINNGGPDITPKKVKDAVDEILALKTTEGLSRKHRSNIKYRLARMTALYGEDECHTLTTAKMDGIINNAELSAITRNGYRKTLCNFFEFCQAYRYVCKDFNPAKACRHAVVAEKEAEIFTPAEMKKVIAACSGELAVHLSWVVLCGFAGFRPSEAARLIWEDVGSDFIRLRGTGAKKTGRRRLVPILPNLKAWLEPLRQKSGKVVDESVNIETAPGIIKKAAGVVWHQDCLRHSFGSYRHAVLRNIEQLVEELGNTEAVARRYYVNPYVTPEQGEEWFSIKPDNSEKITALPAAAVA